MLIIHEVQKVELWIKEEMSKGERIMGMGHAVYKTYDPRAKILKELSRKLAEKTKEPSKPALYRPKAVYVGTYCGPEGCDYTPLDLR